MTTKKTLEQLMLALTDLNGGKAPQKAKAKRSLPQDQPVEAKVPKAPKAPALNPIPANSQYEFKAGQQVCLVNLSHPLKRKFRSHYEYVKRAGKMDVVKRTTDGVECYVWLNKLMPMGEAVKLQKQVTAEHEAKVQARLEAKQAKEQALEQARVIRAEARQARANTKAGAV